MGSLVRIARAVVARVGSMKSVMAPFVVWGAGALALVLAAVIGGGLLPAIAAVGIGLASLAILLLVEFRIATLVDRSRKTLMSTLRQSSNGPSAPARSSSTTPAVEVPDALLEVLLSKSVDQTPRANVSPFTPGAIRETVGDRNKSKQIGRFAAAMDEDEYTDSYLAHLLSPAFREEAPTVDLVGTPEDRDLLADYADVEMLLPGMREVHAREGVSYLIVTTGGLNRGAWRGALNAANFVLYRQLFDCIKEVRMAGGVTMFVESAGSSASHYSQSLRGAVDVRIGARELSEPLDTALHSRIGEALKRIARTSCEVRS
ncbi:hypothetical protein [Dietzia sp. WMMA184]|uniref:hypothetical protein n=1 Tax=Dietzia sp. WMMA184 TaxID=2039808 RepID=UPI001178467D|nr:hypothetical protein [Dietzia sp. WMMA184]